MKIELDNVIQASRHFNGLEVLFKQYGSDKYLVSELPITEICGLAIYKELLKLENRAHKYSEDACNGLLSEEQEEAKFNKLEHKLKSMFKTGSYEYLGLFINLDPRGYALKIKTEVNDTLKADNIILHTDWGSYGILAPKF